MTVQRAADCADTTQSTACGTSQAASALLGQPEMVLAVDPACSRARPAGGVAR
jgi:hypothetical protein